MVQAIFFFRRIICVRYFMHASRAYVCDACVSLLQSPIYISKMCLNCFREVWNSRWKTYLGLSLRISMIVSLSLSLNLNVRCSRSLFGRRLHTSNLSPLHPNPSALSFPHVMFRPGSCISLTLILNRCTLCSRTSIFPAFLSP